MKDIYLVNYSVKGIKTLDELVSLSFYKKTISAKPDTQGYNIKGIYGMNGSGKSAIVTSIDILRNLLINSSYLNNPIVQKYLDAIVNKKIGQLLIKVDYIAEIGKKLEFFQYGVTLSRDKIGKYVISYEQLAKKRVTSKKESMEMIFEVVDGKIVTIKENESNDISDMIKEKTANLLETESICALFLDKIFGPVLKNHAEKNSTLPISIIVLYIFGRRLHVYLDQSDDHKDYFLNNSLSYGEEKKNFEIDSLMKHYFEMESETLNIISITENIVSKKSYNHFEKAVGKLYEFLHIFKSDLVSIQIDKKEDHDFFLCDLIMVYESYKIDAEFESTGIKKLIKLFAYLREMVQGGIVFIDEFDSNLHDVYLCALLEYLMEYGEGQLCFTTHNVGPMDILKQHKKSIDFLSVDHRIYPWTSNGNYSPSRLYRSGMIEGSPFNVDSIDFIGVFNSIEEDE